MIRAGATALALLVGLAGSAQAADCFEQAAGYYGLDATLLRTIAQVESAQPTRRPHQQRRQPGHRHHADQ